MAFLIAYDIADPKRLRRVARRLERYALRCQKSVFLFRGERNALVAVLDEVGGVIDPDEDVVQAWPLPAGFAEANLVRGTPLPIQPAGIVLARGRRLLVDPARPGMNEPETPSEEDD